MNKAKTTAAEATQNEVEQGVEKKAAKKPRTTRSRKKVAEPVADATPAEETQEMATPINEVVAPVAEENKIENAPAMSEESVSKTVEAPVEENKVAEETVPDKAMQPVENSDKQEESLPETVQPSKQKEDSLSEPVQPSKQKEEQPKLKAESPAKKGDKPQSKSATASQPAAKNSQQNNNQQQSKNKPLPRIPSGLIIRDIIDLGQNVGRIPLLRDEQIQQLTLEDAQDRSLFMEAILAQVLDYDIVLSDTNIWLELQVGHTSSHSDPRVNARLTFERQLEFISKLMKRKGGRFMMMAETYEEIDRFAAQQEPTDYRQADWSDEALCRNASARLAKRLILSQQRENRLRIEGIGSESHHASFADPVIIRRCVELFAVGKKVLLLTNDASVAIRSMGMCDDLQRYNDIDDATWNETYAPLRPMVMTMDDLKMLDQFTRQYHMLHQAAGTGWMPDVVPTDARQMPSVLNINVDGFRPGDRQDRQDRQDRRKEQQRQREEQQRQQKEEQRQREEEQRRQKEEQKRLQQEQQRQREEQKRLQKEQQRQKEAEKRQQREAAEKSRKESDAAEKEAQPEAVAVSPDDALKAVQEAAASKPVVDNPVAEAAPAEPVAEAQEDVPVMLPSFAPEDMDLIKSDAKKRSHRGGRRRGGNGTKSKPAAE